MKSLTILCIAIALTACTTTNKNVSEETLKDAFKGKFMIGAAMNTQQAALQQKDEAKLVQEQFNTIVAENCMKHEQIHPEQSRYNFTDADAFVKFGTDNNMFVVGHTLVWHSQTAPWMFQDSEGNRVGRDTLIARMKDHIFTIAGRYKGRVHGWDVVNEAINDNGGLRKSPWTEIIGEDFIELAFKFAHEADPEAELYYNDYNLYLPEKRAELIALVNDLKKKGCRIDGIGMQGHYGLGSPDIKDIENSIVEFYGTGCKVMVTELDVSVLPFPSELTAEVTVKYEGSPEFNPYTDGLPEDIQQALSEQYSNFFKVYLKHHDKISRITFWGVNNGNSWRNYWPIKGRTDYPLLFDRKNQMVPAGMALVKLAGEEQYN